MFIDVKGEKIRADRIVRYHYDEKRNALFLNIDGYLSLASEGSHNTLSISNCTKADYTKFEQELPLAIAQAYSVIRGDNVNVSANQQKSWVVKS